MRKKVEIDGNDGTGKSSLIACMKTKASAFGVYDLEVCDRGQLTLATDSNLFEADPDTLYIILDCQEEISQQRIAGRGDSLEAPYHTMTDLKKYRKRFLELARTYRIVVFDTSDTGVEELSERVLTYIKKNL
ncbi:MAG: hypothetical protein LBD11_02415 [Candidatus Peribacteria bacterium]|jgi:thymidylate kinase|nr:hypothetical protein [Candidatus Peribacteria bacterium]